MQTILCCCSYTSERNANNIHNDNGNIIGHILFKTNRIFIASLQLRISSLETEKLTLQDQIRTVKREAEQDQLSLLKVILYTFLKGLGNIQVFKTVIEYYNKIKKLKCPFPIINTVIYTGKIFN